MDGMSLCSLQEADFLARCPLGGDMLHAQLQVWKTAAANMMVATPGGTFGSALLNGFAAAAAGNSNTDNWYVNQWSASLPTTPVGQNQPQQAAPESQNHHQNGTFQFSSAAGGFPMWDSSSSMSPPPPMYPTNGGQNQNSANLLMNGVTIKMECSVGSPAPPSSIMAPPSCASPCNSHGGSDSGTSSSSDLYSEFGGPIGSPASSMCGGGGLNSSASSSASGFSGGSSGLAGLPIGLGFVHPQAQQHHHSSTHRPVNPHHHHHGGSGAHIHLWQFLKELLTQPESYSAAIRWLDRPAGVFKIEDSLRVARLWGKRKNRPAMNYDKLSRSIRQYYKKGIMKKTERSQRLVYQFCPPYAV